MYRPPTGDMRRPSPSSPSRPAHSNLTIRTSSMQRTRPPATPQSSNSPQPKLPYPVYPIGIQDDKLEKALKMWKIYKDAKHEEAFDSLQNGSLSATTNHHGYHLSVPATPTPGSVTSRTSSKRHRAGSASTSAYGGVTEMSSVMSFDGNEASPLSAKAVAELSTFDGKKVKQRTRKKFSKAAKAKTALVRYLGSCRVCHERRVPCDLELHHDVQTLERILQARTHKQRPSSHHQSHSSMSGPSRMNARSVSAGQATMLQPDALFGLGQNEELQSSAPFDMTHLDIQSPALGDLSPEIPAPATLYYDPPILSDLSSNPYASYQDGNMFPIGVQRDGFFQCHHLSGFCFEFFPDHERLQTHFESTHFSFTRIHPAHRYVCSSCHQFNDVSSGICYHCGQGQIEIWIYGNFIRSPSYHRFTPDGQDTLRNASSAPYYPSAYNFPNSNFQGGSSRNGGSFNQGNYTFQPNSQYENGPSPGYDYNPNNSYMGPGSSGNQFQGNGFQRAWNVIEEKTYSLKPHTSRWKKSLLVLLFLSVILTICLSYTWLSTKVHAFVPRSSTSNLPIIGFVGIVASFAMCSSVKHFTVQRSRSAQCRPQKCPLHALSNRKMRIMGCYRMSAPDTYVRGGVSS